MYVNIQCKAEMQKTKTKTTEITVTRTVLTKKFNCDERLITCTFHPILLGSLNGGLSDGHYTCRVL